MKNTASLTFLKEDRLYKDIVFDAVRDNERVGIKVEDLVAIIKRIDT